MVRSVPSLGGDFGRPFGGGVAALAEQRLQIGAKLIDVRHKYPVAL